MTRHTPTSLLVDLRIVCVLLLIAVVTMLFLWRPWNTVAAQDRTVTVTGEATVTETPDEFTFYPSYEFTNADRSVALAELTKKSDELVGKLKELGVTDKQIKTNASSYQALPFTRTDNQKTDVYTLQLTVTSTPALVQKIQDYLASTNPSGTITPQATFSTPKQTTIRNQARDQATADARKKADQMAHNLGFTLGKVKTIQDNDGSGVIPLFRAEAPSSSQGAADSLGTTQLTVQPGENELHYTVTVTYFIR